MSYSELITNLASIVKDFFYSSDDILESELNSPSRHIKKSEIEKIVYRIISTLSEYFFCMLDTNSITLEDCCYENGVKINSVGKFDFTNKNITLYIETLLDKLNSLKKTYKCDWSKISPAFVVILMFAITHEYLHSFQLALADNYDNISDENIKTIGKFFHLLLSIVVNYIETNLDYDVANYSAACYFQLPTERFAFIFNDLIIGDVLNFLINSGDEELTTFANSIKLGIETALNAFLDAQSCKGNISPSEEYVNGLVSIIKSKRLMRRFFTDELSSTMQTLKIISEDDDALALLLGLVPGSTRKLTREEIDSMKNKLSGLLQRIVDSPGDYVNDLPKKRS